MVMQIDRRCMILGGVWGIGALALPAGRALAADLIGARGFTHAVASGEPGADSMLLWTRYVPASEVESARLDVEVAIDPDFVRIVGGGTVRTGGYRDWTAKVTVDGLQPGTSYWYRFVAPDGSKSPVGRTRTLPQGDVPRFGLGVFSCSNLPYGWFNAYAHAAARDDLDLWLHVGDYIYEYGNASVRPGQGIVGRTLMPDTEILAIADYRLRYATYRADPDLQRLHQMAPMVALWDDHESANDSWEGGAQNHQADKEGDWNTRRAAAMQVYREWMPVSDEPWKAYDIGTLATLYRTESRLLARTRPADITAAASAPDADAALKAFHDGVWQDPSATMLGSTQESWLAHAFRANARTTAWQMVGMGTIIGRTVMPANVTDWLRPDANAKLVQRYRNSVRMAQNGLPMWMDRWDGYPAARSRLLRSAQAADSDLIMLAGDSHNAWAYGLVEDGQPAGVEFAGQAVTSGGMEGDLRGDPTAVARGFVAANRELKWANTHQRGYMMIDISRDRVTGEWLFLDTIKARSTRIASTHRMSVERGRRVFSA
ncbi:putative Alkaline phosphatase [Sphingobium yanoikuyae]|uniref:Alkaline phosphatase D family protein n=1 Tax=Sphingobium yanoikuyae TaxID=13690 RepID=A0A084E9V1_SPHYA|nr:alkaline phosphatase D family protein [Sphingobium yanoikuyae]KEZ14743.1 putative Alkaline phosphatase [Sphingobium yanoikuyae]QJR05627.1 alkaline phosphatase D family protein [Sphingobium yanoikuyae]